MAKEKNSAQKTIDTICRKTRRQHSGEDSIAEQCRREDIAQSLYYKWVATEVAWEFLEAGTARLAGDTQRQATDARRARKEFRFRFG
jgi:transposase